MSNPSKSKGTAAETAVVRAGQRLGFPLAERRALHGGKDMGDILLCPGVILEVKTRSKAVSDGQVEKWLDETFTERINALAGTAALVVKRPGVSAARAEWWTVWMRMSWLYGFMLVNEPSDAFEDDAPISMSLAAYLRLLRRCGWGDPL